MNGNSNDLIPFSERLFSILVGAWDTGKAALTILLIAVICVIAAFLFVLHDNQGAGFVFLRLGAVMVGIVGYHFYVGMIVPARRAAASIENNSEVLDAVQTASLKLTEIIIDLNDFSLMHANQIVETVQSARHLLANLPFGAGLAANKYLEKPDQFARKIHSIAATSRQVVADVGDSIKKSDLKRIRSHINGLQRLKDAIEHELALKD